MRLFITLFVAVICAGCTKAVPDDRLTTKLQHSISELRTFIDSEHARSAPKVREINRRVLDVLSTTSVEELRQTRIVYAEITTISDNRALVLFWVGDTLLVDRAVMRVQVEGEEQPIELPLRDYYEKELRSAEESNVYTSGVFELSDEHSNSIESWDALDHVIAAVTLKKGDVTITSEPFIVPWRELAR